MKLAEFKLSVDDYRKELRKNSGELLQISETGPVGMRLMDELIILLERQEQQIIALQKKVNELENRPATAG